MRRRAVIVQHPTEFDELMNRYPARGQVEFVLRSRGHTPESVERAHKSRVAALIRVRTGIPDGRASTDVERDSLSCFSFASGGVIVVVGPDSLVADITEYADTQVVVGINSVPEFQAGVLVRCVPEESIRALCRLDEDADLRVDHPTMVQMSVDDLRSLQALNKILIGHPGYQSIRYKLRSGSVAERQSSPGLVVSTGAGATGQEASLKHGHHTGELPAPTSCSLVWFVHKAWPLPFTGVEYTRGIPDEDGDLGLVVASESPVSFDDSMESDRLTLTWGRSMWISCAPRALFLAGLAELGEG